MKQTFTKLGMIVAFMLSFLSASAYDFEVDGIYYEVTDVTKLECKVVKGKKECKGEVVIPSTVNFNSRTLSVVAIGNAAFQNCSSLTSVSIPDSVTIIEDYAFYGCSSLTSVTIGNSVTIIDYYAFGECRSLTSVTIPDSVTSIGRSAFEGCSSLTSVTIPNSVTRIGQYAFCFCESLATISFPESLISLGGSAFSNTSIDTISIPNSVKELGEFANATYKSIILGDGIEEIPYGFFEGCKNLNHLEFSSSIKRILLYLDYYHKYKLMDGATGNISVKEEKYKKYFTFNGTNLKSLKINYSPDPLELGYWYYYRINYDDLTERFIEGTGWSAAMENWMAEVTTLYIDRELSYYNFRSIIDLSLGEHIKTVDRNLVSNENLKTMTCYSSEPPTLPSCSNKQYLYVVVKVPQESLEKYQQAENWKNFWNLQGFDPSQASVDEIPATTVERVETGRYDLNGCRVSDDYEGIVIVRYSDGSARKLMAR